MDTEVGLNRPVCAACGKLQIARLPFEPDGGWGKVGIWNPQRYAKSLRILRILHFCPECFESLLFVVVPYVPGFVVDGNGMSL